MSKRKKRERRAEAVATQRPGAVGVREWRSAAIVALITLVAYLPALRNGFVTFDDDRNFVDNPAYRGLGAEQLQWMWTTFHTGHWIPLTWMTFGLDYELWGMNPAGYHFVNIVLHAGVAALAFVIARRLMRIGGVLGAEEDRLAAVVPPLFAALAFALHPLRVESVAWVTERRDELSLLFALGSLLAYLRYVRNAEHRQRNYWLSVALFACGLLSKATVMSWPVVLVVIDVYPLRRTDSRRFIDKGPYALLAVGAAVVSMFALPPRPQLAVAGKIAVSMYSLAFYLVKQVVPLNLSPLYPLPVQVNAMSLQSVASALLILVVTVGAVVTRHRWPAVLASWAAFVAIELPMLGAVQNGPQIAADRYTYHASLALTILAGTGIAMWTRRSRPGAAMLAGAVVVALCLGTWNQLPVWRDSIALWSRVVALHPEAAIAENGLGDALQNDSTVSEAMKGERLRDAIVHYERAVAISPVYDEAHNNLGIALAMSGNTGEAVRHFARALQLNPSLQTAHYNWGNALFASGDFPRRRGCSTRRLFVSGRGTRMPRTTCAWPRSGCGRRRVSGRVQ